MSRHYANPDISNLIDKLGDGIAILKYSEIRPLTEKEIKGAIDCLMAANDHAHNINRAALAGQATMIDQVMLGIQDDLSITD